VRRRFLGVIAGGGAALAGTALTAGLRSAPAEAQQTSNSLVGAWLVTVPMTPRGRFMSVQTFSADGTTVGQAESAGEDRGASLGCGIWAQTGDRRFALTFATGLYDPRTGATNGYAKAQATLVLDETGDAWNAEGRFTFFDPDGRQPDQTPLFPVHATRIRLEPLT
jgi:hypothetical protein